MKTTNTIKELTNKIYLEGIEKAKQEADLILRKAEADAEKIISEAKKNELEIATKIQSECNELMQNTEAELRLAANKFTNNLKQEISSKVLSAQIDAPFSKAFNDTDFIQKLVLTMIEKWNPETNESLDIRLHLPKEIQEDLELFFNSKAKEALDKGFEVNFSQDIKKGMKIEQNSHGYRIDFTDESFMNYFKTYLKESTKSILFNLQ